MNEGDAQSVRDIDNNAHPFDLMGQCRNCKIERLNDIGIALSSERNAERLMELILLGAKELTHADAGTMYRVTDRQTLKFEILRTDSLGIAMGGSTGIAIHFPELPLYENGVPNLRMIAVCSALKETTINIPDAYETKEFDFSGTRAFDLKNHYHSKSFLTVPLKNHLNEIIGVMQLINAKDLNSQEIVAFSTNDQKLAESLASQAAIALTNQKLIADLKALFESFIQVIAGAIDEKSPYTGGHCHRVPLLAEMLGKSASATKEGPLQDFYLSEEKMYELKVAAWLHDCGKVVTPTEVVDKGTKLETIFDRIHLLDTRLEVVKRDLKVAFLEKKIALLEAGVTGGHAALEEAFHQQCARLDQDREFLRKANIGGEFMSPQDQERVRGIARSLWIDPNGVERPLLSDNEVYNLTIPKGTITKEERTIINNHVVATIRMLGAIPFPKHLQEVPEIAGGHHEQMNGKGYPKGLLGEQMSIQARIMAIADVFEALTARDRPYKKGKTLSESLKILGLMKEEGHIDPDLFKVFIDERIYLDYAMKYLDPEQIDSVNPAMIPGYVP
ncbi:HD family phosphohydrolase [Candidatus Magnetaquicoccus inordinatus]|uniref:HD family phosphohydrolase n=1 Tax=Candidatus Magnetaquicoccus inordinatus TaxID=2496818 RepID=UPI001D0E5655|nr:HD family phosphohydrolase [Candidatus Magnetaquicoccus inordinatus]